MIVDDSAEQPALHLPEPVRAVAKQWLSRGQKAVYGGVFDVRVVGAQFIPYNRHCLVVANHASHLDQGLVKHALGSYGEGMVTLAAQDYFFEGTYKKAYFEQLTNLVPMPRSGSLRAVLRQAGDLLTRGKTVLIFPEGTRSSDGQLRPFKAAMGHLALRHSVDILPIWLEGAAEVLPKGTKLPRGRQMEARIGPPLLVSDLREATLGLSPSDSARVVTRIAHRAVTALAEGRQMSLPELDVQSIRRTEVPEDDRLSGLFEELKRRFVPGVLDTAVSYYFSLGEERWTVRATQSEVEVARGKTVATADCVLKTTPQIFERIVRQAWVPGPADFVSGQVKTNDVAHLMLLQKVFCLTTPTDRLPGGPSWTQGDAELSEGAGQ